MPALKACFEAGGFAEVATYIQSGNVLFTSPETRVAGLTQRIEEMLAATFGYQATVVVWNRAQMRAVSSTRRSASARSWCRRRSPCWIAA